MGVCGCAWVCECVCGMISQNIYWRIESLHQQTLIRILYEFLYLAVFFRDRDRELRILLHHLHPILKRQEITYIIYVIEQAGKTPFNR